MFQVQCRKWSVSADLSVIGNDSTTTFYNDLQLIISQHCFSRFESCEWDRSSRWDLKRISALQRQFPVLIAIKHLSSLFISNDPHSTQISFSMSDSSAFSHFLKSFFCSSNRCLFTCYLFNQGKVGYFASGQDQGNIIKIE
jgi:hypothetical protein